mgnify:CR=1 FL=1
MKKIYLAIGETEDGTRSYENAYATYGAARSAAQKMVEEIEHYTDMKLLPMVEEIDFIDE